MAKYVKTEDGYKEIEAINSNKMNSNNPVGTGSFSMGRKAGSVIGTGSHAEGAYITASGNYSHAEGYNTAATGVQSHAEGNGTTASGEYSHAEGNGTTASGYVSHAEGIGTTASGSYSHAEGSYTKATGFQSHAEGYYTKASGGNSHVEGKYNIDDTADKYAHIVGNGTSNISRSNAHTLDWNGVGWFKNSVKVGGSSQDDSVAKTLATTDYVDTTVSTKISGKQDTLIQSGATVGQIAKITAVDSDGKPTAWQAVDMPSGGGSGVQPDWNQNDETAEDYVKNRPFYTGNPAETVLVEESTVSFADAGGSYMAQFPSTFSATVGETYKVTWDGTAYECACVDLKGFTFIGNQSIGDLGSDTGEPFVMNVLNGSGIYIYTADTSASHIFSISGFAVEVVKINEQYLPDSAFTEADWDFVSNRPLFYKQLNANIIAENITENIRVGTNYVDLGVTAPDFNEGLYYKVEGEILFVNNSANTGYRLQINGYYKANSSAEISLGTVYDEYSRKNLDVGFYGGNNSYGRAGKLYVSSSGHSQSYTITANFAIISELKQLSEDYIPNTIQRVGDDVIIASSTANSTKKFKITVDDSGTLTATEVS